jgi:phosphoglycerate dehydrogenase-like enzyme
MSDQAIFICRDHMSDPLLDHVANALKQKQYEVIRGPVNKPGEVITYSREEITEFFGRVSVAMFTSRNVCSDDLMRSAPRLHSIVSPSIGVDTIDVSAATNLGILVANGSTPENFVGMAEASIMLMLNLLFGLRESQKVMNNELPRPLPSQRFATTLRGKTIGLIGWGNISRAIAERLRVFEVNILLYSRHVEHNALPDYIRLTDFDSLMSQSDVVGVYVALNQHTRQIIDARALALMKKTAFLVNVSRGHAVDEQALIDALKQRQIAGAALDTFTVEPLPSGSQLRSLPNVILTPHMVGQTREGFAAGCEAAISNITSVVMGRVPDNCLNSEVKTKWRRHHA